MKTNKYYYEDRQLEKTIGDYEDDLDNISELVRTVVFAVKRNRKTSYLIRYLKREKLNTPLSVIKKVIKKNKKIIDNLEPYYDYRVKENVFDNIKNDLVIYMRDYRIDQVDSE